MITDMRAYQKAYKQRRIENGLCISCGATRTPADQKYRHMCLSCREVVRAKSRERTARMINPNPPMRNMSFTLTKQQVLAGTKTVTRRTGWKSLVNAVARGERPKIMACEKCMGLKKGEKVVKIRPIEVVDARLEPLNRMTSDTTYGLEECVKEGFGDHPRLMWPSEFVEFFSGSHAGCKPDSMITRIEFRYL